ncbi:MAG: hypothetical protein AAF543_06275, partial [Pseudomonadota bacterium]
MSITKNGAPASRRALLATSIAAAGTGLLAAPAIAATEAVVDPHPAWLQHWLDVHRESWNAWYTFRARTGMDPDDFEWEHERLERLIATTPARTPQGAYAQMQLLWEGSGGHRHGPLDCTADASANVMAFLEAQEA